MQGNSGQQNQGQRGSQNQNTQPQKPAGLSWSQPMSMNQSGTTKPISPTAQPTQRPLVASSHMASQPKRGNKKFLGILAGGILVGFIIGWAWFALRSSAPVVTNSDTPAEGSTAAVVQNSALPAAVATVGATTGSVEAGSLSSTLLVTSPQAAGDVVQIANAKVIVPTWVVVYDSNNGVRGNALGAALFFPGSTKGSITLLRATVSGKTYFVGENVDDGNRQFSMQSDKPVMDTSGKPLYVELKAQ